MICVEGQLTEKKFTENLKVRDQQCYSRSYTQLAALKGCICSVEDKDQYRYPGARVPPQNKKNAHAQILQIRHPSTP
jgi:hypothetical protein